jgi:DNA-binding transcriptional ArsR family regulator
MSDGSGVKDVPARLPGERQNTTAKGNVAVKQSLTSPQHRQMSGVFCHLRQTQIRYVSSKFKCDRLNEEGTDRRRRNWRSEKPCSVAELTRALPVSQPAISQHLKAPREAHLVQAEADGASDIYHVDPLGHGLMRPWIDQMWDDALDLFKNDIWITRDRLIIHVNPFADRRPRLSSSMA